MYYVYQHTEGKEVVYVGSGNGSRQFHKNRFRSDEHADWIETMLERVGKSYSKIVKYFELESDARYFERLMIKKYQPRFNQRYTKDYKMSDEHKAKISASNSGEKHKFFGKKHSAESKAKMRESHLGVKLSAEHRANIGNAHRGQKRSAEARANMSAAQSGDKSHMFGKKHSEETRAKIGNASRGRKFSAETRAKIGNASRGKKLSDETKAKLRAAAIKHWENRRRNHESL